MSPLEPQTERDANRFLEPRVQIVIHRNVQTVHGPNHHYPVFGKVLRGLDVIDKIVAAARDQADNPLEPIAYIAYSNDRL